jgi:hypothetical protein
MSKEGTELQRKQFGLAVDLMTCRSEGLEVWCRPS